MTITWAQITERVEAIVDSLGPWLPERDTCSCPHCESWRQLRTLRDDMKAVEVVVSIDAWVYHGFAAALQGVTGKEWATEDGTWTAEFYDTCAPEEGAELPVHVTITREVAR